ncbi:hypothetical protein AB0N20_21550 [Streptomyces griseoincarnatus]
MPRYDDSPDAVGAPGTGRELTVEFAGRAFTLRIAAGAEAAMAPVLSFIAPHFPTRPTPAPPACAALQIDVEPYDAWQPPNGGGERTLVRKTGNPARDVWGSRWRQRRQTLLHIPASSTAFALDDDATHAVVYVSAHSQYHVSDFLRDVAWELAAGHGWFIHAAAVSTQSGVIALVGPKGAGKTTTAIEFMRAGADFFTGDVLFLARDDNACHSFPDYPHIGWGTLRSHQELAAEAQRLGLKPAADQDKVFLPHDVYRIMLGAGQGRSPLPLRAVVLPQVATHGAARITRSGAAESIEAMPRETTYADQGWEPFVRLLRTGTALEQSLVSHPGLDRALWFSRLGRGRPAADQMAAVLGQVRGPFPLSVDTLETGP